VSTRTLVLVGAVAGALLVACGGAVAEQVSGKPQTEVTQVSTVNVYGDNEYWEMRVNGRRCVLVESDRDWDIALSCDWSAK
jgi:hypothetical protein